MPTSAVKLPRPIMTPPLPAFSPTIAYNGSGLNVDYPGYLPQHDLVYTTLPQEAGQGMPIGDGDLAGVLWCADGLQIQVQKSDLWDDPYQSPHIDNAQAEAGWRLLSAGAVSINTEPGLLHQPTRFEQRLSLYSGLITLEADSPGGACQITAFASATAGVLVIHYQDQTVRGAQRHIDVSLWRKANLFAMNDMVGILQALRDRRYAMIAWVEGRPVTVRMLSQQAARIEIAPSRSSSFTLYLSVGVSPRDGDPIRLAKSRLQAAQAKGYETLLREHRNHWAMFWQKSFVQLSSANGDLLPSYLESLWYLNLYHQACGARGFDAPLANGGLFLNQQDRRTGTAVYEGEALRAGLAPLLASNHLEQGVSTVDTLHRMLPNLAARTGRELGIGGARCPARFSRHGDEFPGHEVGQRHFDGEEGLNTALLVWEAWRYTADPFFLRERAYPLLRACTTYALERAQMIAARSDGGIHFAEETLNSETRAALAAALRRLLWAAKDLDIEVMEPTAEWQTGLNWLGRNVPPYRPAALFPMGLLTPEETAGRLESLIELLPQGPQGWFASDPCSPDMRLSAELVTTVNGLLLCEEPMALHTLSFHPVTGSEKSEGPEEEHESQGASPGVLRVFPSLPPTWNAAFTLAAPGGFRVSAEAASGVCRYVAVRSLLGGACRILNPWFGLGARVLDGREVIYEGFDPILAFETRRNATYLIECLEAPISRTVRIKLKGNKNERIKTFSSHQLGL